LPGIITADRTKAAAAKLSHKYITASQLPRDSYAALAEGLTAVELRLTEANLDYLLDLGRGQVPVISLSVVK
jgi:hypothetical protein